MASGSVENSGRQTFESFVIKNTCSKDGFQIRQSDLSHSKSSGWCVPIASPTSNRIKQQEGVCICFGRLPWPPMLAEEHEERWSTLWNFLQKKMPGQGRAFCYLSPN